MAEGRKILSTREILQNHEAKEWEKRHPLQNFLRNIGALVLGYGVLAGIIWLFIQAQS